MIVKRFTFTIVAFLTFLAASMYSLGTPSNDVSPETFGHRVVKQGLLSDGASILELTEIAPRVSPGEKFPNPTRTLRAFIGGANGRDALYIETVKPHAYYVLRGGFSVSRSDAFISWAGDSTVAVRAKSREGEQVFLRTDVATGDISYERFTQETERSNPTE